MKLKQDFVTNSSSTSFLISLKDNWTEANFLEAIGIEGDMPINEIFRQLFDAIERSKQKIQTAMAQEEPPVNSVSDFLKDKGFEKETISIVERLLLDNRTVYYGSLNSETYLPAEAYFLHGKLCRM